MSDEVMNAQELREWADSHGSKSKYWAARQSALKALVDPREHWQPLDDAMAAATDQQRRELVTAKVLYEAAEKIERFVPGRSSGLPGAMWTMTHFAKNGGA